MENKQVKKYMLLLSNIKNGLDDGRKLSDIKLEYKGSGLMYSYLIKNNIIIKGSVKGNNKWNDKIPVTYKLAETIVNSVSRSAIEYHNNNKTNRTPKPSLPITNNKSREFSFLWGLLKFKY